MPETTPIYRIRWTVADPDPAPIPAERQRRSAFVVVTDDPDRAARELVAADQGQDPAEHAFRWAKSP